MPRKKKLTTTRSDLMWVPVDEIDVREDDNYTRTRRGDIPGLAMTIARNGIQLPLRAYKQEGVYVLRSGFRRMAAVSLINEDPDGFGLTGPIEKVPVLPVSRSTNEAERAVLQMLENSQRCDASPMEEAKQLRALIEVHGLPKREICASLGMKPKALNDRLALLKASQPIRKAVADGKVAPTVAADIARRHEGDEQAQQKALRQAEQSSGLRGRATVRSARKAAPAAKPRQKTRSVVDVKEAITEIDEILDAPPGKYPNRKNVKLDTIKATLEWVLGADEKPWDVS